MSEQDDPDLDADVIEQASRQFSLPAIPGLPSLRGIAGTRRRWLVIIAAAGALLVTAATLVTFRLAAGPPAGSASAGLIREVTTVPVGKSVPGLAGLSASDSDASAYSSTLLAGGLTAVSGSPLTLSGKPEVLYVANEYCPFCTAQSWPLIIALSRFGEFSGLGTSRSPTFDKIPPIDGWTFYGSSYKSPYLAFAPVETYSNVLVNPKADPGDPTSYRRLQRLTPAEQAVFHKFDGQGQTPFIDFGGTATALGTDIIPATLTGLTWSQIAADLRRPDSTAGGAILFSATVLTAELCRLTGNRPAAACSKR